MTPDPSFLIGVARGVLLLCDVCVTCLHSGSWILTGLAPLGKKAGAYWQQLKRGQHHESA